MNKKNNDLDMSMRKQFSPQLLACRHMNQGRIYIFKRTQRSQERSNSHLSGGKKVSSEKIKLNYSLFTKKQASKI
jgi:hypothetical protein